MTATLALTDSRGRVVLAEAFLVPWDRHGWSVTLLGAEADAWPYVPGASYYFSDREVSAMRAEAEEVRALRETLCGTTADTPTG